MEAADGGLPETSRSEILQVLEEFDEEHRGEGRWADWQSNRNHKHAIEHEGRLYPVKQIVSMATGRHTRSFSGGEQANSYVREHGFGVTRLRSQPLREALKEVLDIYVETRETHKYGKTDEDGKTLRIWELFEEIEELLEESSVLSQRPHVKIDWTLGHGRWVHGPWIAFLDERLTSGVKEGFHPSFGLRPDKSEITIGYIIGLNKVRDAYGAQVGTAILQNRAQRLRGRSLHLEDEGFTVPDGPAQKGDQLKVIAQKYYEEGGIPPDEDLLSELDILLQTYDRHVSQETTGFSIDIDRSRLNAAVDNIIRPAILERKDLEDTDFEGYQHQEIIPNGTPKLTPAALSESPRESVLDALRADVNLLSGNWQKSPAIKFFKRADPSAIQDEVSNLLYGRGELSDRVERFMGWGEDREIEDGRTAGLDGTVASYLLFLSDPQQYAFCKTARAYRPAVKALLGDEEVRSDWPVRVAHARDFYKETLRVFQEEHEELPFFDLMHVHIAFYLAENEDEDAPWGEGRVETGDSTCLLIRSNQSSEWDDEEGWSYHFGQTVPNYTQVESGTKFLIDRSFRAGPNRIIAKGRFGAVEKTGTGEDGREEYRAKYDQYEPLLPPRPVMGSEESILEEQEGYNVQHAIRRLSPGAFEELAEPPTAWIFQANPDKFDVRSSLQGREGEEHTWTVNQYADDIDVGDRVYLWESGSEGGIVGTAYVTEPPDERAAFDWEKEFQVQEDPFEGKQERAVLHVDQAAESPLGRDTLQDTADLEDLSILQFANATNFPVEPDEAETIERLLGTDEKPMSSKTGGDRLGQTQDLPPDVEEHRDLLLGEKQIIFAGPPGTSKTYEAFEIISALNGTYREEQDPTAAISEARFSGDSEKRPTTGVVWDIVQFHQSYGYEDFVSGIEADTVSAEEGRKQLTFDREKRIFLQLVEAAQNRDVPHVLVIDEINRGALGRVFGELILTLEYRNLPVRLPGQKETIEIPENLHLIGTMNTADRNISLVDHALRRRFHFVERLPEAGRLNRYLQGQGVEDAELMLEAFQAVQSAFTGEDGEYAEDARGYGLKDYAVGHTYFMVESSEELWRNLNRQVIPLLEEYQKEGILTDTHLRKAARDLTEVTSGEGPPPELTDWCERYR